MPKPLEAMVDSKVQALEATCATLYQASFPKDPADETFWYEVSELEKDLTKKLKSVKPLEIMAACKVYQKGFRQSLLGARKRAKETK